MKYSDDFCAFILTHGRPDKVYTYDSLMKSGYSGKVYIVIDDEDKTAKQYRKQFGDMVLTFSKSEIAKTFDEGDNFNDRRAIIYARNACFELSKQVGCKYFIQLDDDYMTFSYKFDKDGVYQERKILKIDNVLEYLLDFYLSVPNLLSIAFAQNGDFIGGAEGTHAKNKKLMRKCMNTFICSTDRPFQFFGRINEDVNTYTNLGNRGGLFFTFNQIAISQKQTQSNSGGMTDLYLDSGTYVKSFYSVMYMPSSVKISLMGSTHKRLHHNVSWRYTVPMIISERHRKGVSPTLLEVSDGTTQAQ